MIDWDMLQNPAFIILLGVVWLGTILAWIYTKKQGMEAFSIPMLLAILIGEVVIVYAVVARG